MTRRTAHNGSLHLRVPGRRMNPRQELVPQRMCLRSRRSNRRIESTHRRSCMAMLRRTGRIDSRLRPFQDPSRKQRWDRCRQTSRIPAMLDTQNEHRFR